MGIGNAKLYKRILAALLCVLATVYLIYHIAGIFKKDMSLFTVRPYTARDSAAFTGYIFREETVLTSYVSGMNRYYYYDGEKVGAGKTVADVYRYGNAEIAAQIEEQKKQIEILRRSSSLGKLTLDEVEEKIDRLTFSIAEKNATGETAAANALGDELLVLLAKKDLLESGKNSYDTEIAVLEARLASLVSTLGSPNASVSTPRSGYFYSETDGYESIFTSEIARDVSLETFDALIQTPPSYTTNAVGTLLTSTEWYYVAKTTAENVEGFLVGMTYDCLFVDNGYSEEIPMKLVSKETENGTSLVIFFSSSLPQNFDITRCQRMEAVKEEYSGFRIPIETVRVKDGITYVYIFKEGCASPREIDILWEQNGYFIISSSFEGKSDYGKLKLNDLIILDEPDLYDGKIMN